MKKIKVGDIVRIPKSVHSCFTAPYAIVIAPYISEFEFDCKEPHWTYTKCDKFGKVIEKDIQNYTCESNMKLLWNSARAEPVGEIIVTEKFIPKI